MKVLFVSHVANFQKFNNPYIRWLQERGCIVHYASYDDETVETADKFYKIDFRRNPVNPHNIKALFQLIKLFKRERYDLIHCHSPVGALLTRIAARFVPGSKIIYTAHGFHFYKGAPLKNKLIYETAERLMAPSTDIIVTINNEDYEAAKSFRLRKSGAVFFLNGVGVDTEAVRKNAVRNDSFRAELGLSPDTFTIVTVAELIKRKNYETSLKAFALADIPDSRYLICGKGTEQEALMKLCRELNISHKVTFLGYRRDIYRILGNSDVFLFPSHQEGLPVSVIEAMAAGLPCILSDIRGNNQLCTPDSGILLKDNDVQGFADALNTLKNNSSIRCEMGKTGRLLSEQYDITLAVNKMGDIYRTLFPEL